jgi:outer membrane lipoprotein carrier protein
VTRLRTHGWWLVGAWVCLAVGTAAADDALATALRRLQARYEDTRTMRATFKQTVTSQTLSGALESTGRVLFEKPNRMRWDYDPPDGQVIVGDGTDLWIFQPDLEQAIRAPLAQAFQSRTPLTFLAGLGRIERDFDASLESEDAETWELRLVPKGDESLGKLTLRVRKLDASIAEARITDPLGTTTALGFSDEERNVEIAAERFRFEPPPGVDVVRPPTY